MFTGQEYEPETGLYNYKARIYDPETGRFLQPDPVHTDQPGQDNWDRYQYVWNNPVNFSDPTGEKVGVPTSAANFLSLYAFSQGDPFAQSLWVTMMLLWKPPDQSAVAPWHNYSGNTNRDPFSRFNSEKGRADIGLMLQIAFLVSNIYSSETNQQLSEQEQALSIVIFYWAANQLAPKPTTGLDAVAVRHDREVPSSNADVFGAGEKEDRRHIKASGAYIRGAYTAFDSHYFRNLYDKYYDQFDWIGGEAGSLLVRPLAAAGMTLLTFQADFFVVRPLGMALFGADLAVRSIRHTFRKIDHWSKGRFRGFKIHGPGQASIRGIKKWRL
jgi:RHS repeat-associated protein